MSNLFLLLCILTIVKLAKFALRLLNAFRMIFFLRVRPCGRKMMRPSNVLIGMLGMFLIFGLPRESCAWDKGTSSNASTTMSATTETVKPMVSTTAPTTPSTPSNSTTPETTTTPAPPSHVWYSFSGDIDLAELSKVLKNVTGTAQVEDSRPGVSTGGQFPQFSITGNQIETTTDIMKQNGSFTGVVASLKFISNSPPTNSTTTTLPTSTPSATTTATSATTQPVSSTTTTPPTPCVLPFKYKVLIFISMCILVIFILGLLSVLCSSGSWRCEELKTSCAIWKSNMRARYSRRRMRLTVNPFLSRFRNADNPAAHQNYPVDVEAYELL